MSMVELIDTSAMHLLHDITQCAFLDGLMPFISMLGTGGFIWIVVTFFLLLNKPTRRTGIAMAAAMLMCFLFGNLFLKNLIARPRPYTVDPDIILLVPKSAEQYSFPSGHTMNNFSAAVTLMLRKEKFAWAAIVLAALTAFSRVYLMMHYPTDVIAGALIGSAAAYICCHALKRREQHALFQKK